MVCCRKKRKKNENCWNLIYCRICNLFLCITYVIIWKLEIFVFLLNIVLYFEKWRSCYFQIIKVFLSLEWIFGQKKSYWFDFRLPNLIALFFTSKISYLNCIRTMESDNHWISVKRYCHVPLWYWLHFLLLRGFFISSCAAVSHHLSHILEVVWKTYPIASDRPN